VRLLFLDRDGTLNRSLGGRPPNTPDEVELFPDVKKVLPRYIADGWVPVIVTNQGGVASGFLTEAQAHAIQQRVVKLLPVQVAASYLCPHKADGRVAKYAIDCPNRKPRPGAILDALTAFEAQADDCLFVGDSITDKEAAHAARVPFQWADQFFGRPLNRGFIAGDGRWVQLRQARISGEKGLYIRAERRGKVIGSIHLPSEYAMSTPSLADFTLDVDAPYRTKGIDQLLMNTAMEWTGA
jgi:D-glycero-D-manno-heptose 1,7-bisphosphate phosphatase